MRKYHELYDRFNLIISLVKGVNLRAIVRPNFLQNEVTVKFYNFHFCSIVAKFIPMNMHVCVSAHKGNIFICWRICAGEVLPAKFAAKFLSNYVVRVCGEVCGEELAKFYLLLFSSLKESTKISQQTSPCTKAPNPKESTRRQNFLHQIYSFKSLSRNLDYQFLWGQCFDAAHFRVAHVLDCRFRWLQQGSWFFFTRKKVCRHFRGTLGPTIAVQRYTVYPCIPFSKLT